MVTVKVYLLAALTVVCHKAMMSWSMYESKACDLIPPFSMCCLLDSINETNDYLALSLLFVPSLSWTGIYYHDELHHTRYVLLIMLTLTISCCVPPDRDGPRVSMQIQIMAKTLLSST